MVGDFNIQWLIEQAGLLKIIKDIRLKKTTNQLDPIDILQNTPPHTAEYTFFPSVFGIFITVDHIQSYQTNLNEFKRI